MAASEIMTLFPNGNLTGLLAATDTFWQFLGQMGDVLALGLAALGSCIGIGMAGQSAAGAWGKEAKAGKNLNFTYIVLIGMPISQTLYAMIVMLNMRSVIDQPPPAWAKCFPPGCRALSAPPASAP